MAENALNSPVDRELREGAGEAKAISSILSGSQARSQISRRASNIRPSDSIFRDGEKHRATFQRFSIGFYLRREFCPSECFEINETVEKSAPTSRGAA
jgi:hypothetical protein